MPSASAAARSIRPLETIHEDELGGAALMSHAIFLPKEETPPSAPIPVPGQSGLPDAVTLTTAGSSSTPQRTVTSHWRSRRSVSLIRYGRKTVNIIRLDDSKVGFGRRRSPAPGHSQTTGLGRKAPRLELVAARVPGTTVSASDLVSLTKEKLELRAKIRELVQAGRAQSLPSRVRASSKKASSPHERPPMDEDQAASAAAVFSP